MGNSSTKVNKDPHDVTSYDQQGGFHIFNIEGNVSGMEAALAVMAVLAAIYALCMCCTACRHLRRSRHDFRPEDRQTLEQVLPRYVSVSPQFVPNQSFGMSSFAPPCTSTPVRQQARMSALGTVDPDNLFPVSDRSGRF